MPVITVTQINKYIGSILKGDRKLQGIMVKGEISNFVCHRASGHYYFTLKDSESSLKAVMFAYSAKRLKFLPEDGMSVIAIGSVSVFERDGVYQLYVNDIVPDGVGAESVALEQLKKKLAKEGIFDAAHKRPLPVMPKKIGVVTSLSGDALQDIIKVLTSRYPICELYAVDSLVQGENAPDSISRGILKAEGAGCDVIIVGRGGGSSDNLNAFNTEKVAYAIYNCKVPVISAVGHEMNYTVADLAADIRVPTPTAAAVEAAPSLEQLYKKIESLENRVGRASLVMLDRCTEKFISLNARLAMNSPENRLKLTGERLGNLDERINSGITNYMAHLSAKLGEKIAKLDALSPLKVLSRGYSLVYKGDELLKSSDTLNTGDCVRISFGKGGAEAEIKNKW